MYNIELTEEQRQLLLKLVRAEQVIAKDYQAQSTVSELEELDELLS